MYDYPADTPKYLWSGLRQFEKPGGAWDMQALKDRLLYRQAIETTRCLEGVLTSVHDANIGSIFGIGFPAWTGGALQFNRFRGHREVRGARRRAGGEVRPAVRVPGDRQEEHRERPIRVEPARLVAVGA